MTDLPLAATCRRPQEMLPGESGWLCPNVSSDLWPATWIDCQLSSANNNAAQCGKLILVIIQQVHHANSWKSLYRKCQTAVFHHEAVVFYARFISDVSDLRTRPWIINSFFCGSLPSGQPNATVMTLKFSKIWTAFFWMVVLFGVEENVCSKTQPTILQSGC